MSEVIRTADLDPGFKFEIENVVGGEKIKRCFNCTGCTVTCPITEIDETFNPRKILRKAIIGMRKEVLTDPNIWRCASCYMCYDHCPQDVRITEVLGAIRHIAQKEVDEGKITIESDKPRFEKYFINSIKKHGRVHELIPVVHFIWKTKGIGGLMEYRSTGMSMFLKGKINLLPHSVKGKKEIKKIFAGVKK